VKYRAKDKRMLSFYEYIFESCKQYDVLLVNHENVYHPDFIKHLSQIVYTVLYTGDDPESSYLCSVPYVWAFDHVLCYGVYYNETTKMTDKLIEWGAKRSTLRPYGYEFYTHDENIAEKDLFSIDRDIDVIYVGGPYDKISRLKKLKKALGRKLKIYGNWGGVRALVSIAKNHKWLMWASPLPQSQFVATYQRTKIGINMHMSYGPSNLRMWQLPINGVMQITDNPKGTEELFELNKEIVCYENGDMDEAIDKIKYYLDHNDERIAIARAGYERALRDYSYEKCFLSSIKEIEKGIQNKRESKR
jgi:glycosyltransferase involved in cell wall biosynthesis